MLSLVLNGKSFLIHPEAIPKLTSKKNCLKSDTMKQSEMMLSGEIIIKIIEQKNQTVLSSAILIFETVHQIIYLKI